MLSNITSKPATVIYDDKATELVDSALLVQDLWVSLEDLTASTGWEVKPEGVCKDELCVQIPAASRGLVFDADADNQRFNLTGFARYLEQPCAHDAEHNLWVFGPRMSEWRNRLMSDTAPDFTLPNLEGKRYSLQDFRGGKIILAFWSSW